MAPAFAPKDWMTGPDDGQLWIIDMVAPYGSVEMVRSTKSGLTFIIRASAGILSARTGEQPYWTHLVQRDGALGEVSGDPTGGDSVGSAQSVDRNLRVAAG